MIGQRRDHRGLLFAVCGAVLCLTYVVPLSAQERSKDIKSAEVIDRPTAIPGNAPANVNLGTKSDTIKSKSDATYHSSKPFKKRPPTPTMEYSQLGVTVWRLLKRDGSDPKECGDAQLRQPIEGDAPLEIGSMVQIGIEPLTHDGFLYVINREQFADGTFEATKLIYPTARTPNNWVLKGQLVLLPKPSCFIVNPSKTGKRQVAELLTYILSPTRLELPGPLGEGGTPLSDALFKSWEKQWSAPINILQMNLSQADQVKKPMDGAKSLDDVRDSQQLSQADPLPRTIYRATVRKGRSLLVPMSLPFKPSTP